jgi:hypothetical protein
MRGSAFIIALPARYGSARPEFRNLPQRSSFGRISWRCQKVRAELDTALPDGASRVIVHLVSGEVLSETVVAARGSLADPLSDLDLETKLRDGLRLGGSAWNADTIIADVWRLDQLADVSNLMNSHDGTATQRSTVSTPVRTTCGKD